MGVARAGRSEAVHPAGGGVGVARVRRRHHARHVRRHCGHMLQLHRQRLVRPKQKVLPKQKALPDPVNGVQLLFGLEDEHGELHFGVHQLPS